MKLHNRIIPSFLAAAAITCGAAHAQDGPAGGRDEPSFRPWIGTLGVRFPSENLFEDTTLPRFPGERRTTSELSRQARTAGLQGFGLGGEWRPFRNGFRLNFAMYFDSMEPDEPAARRSWKLFDGVGSGQEESMSLTSNIEAVPYVGLGWKTSDGGLGVNLDVGAFLPGNANQPIPYGTCLDPSSPLSECDGPSFANHPGRLSGSFRSFEWYPVVSLGIEYRF